MRGRTGGMKRSLRGEEAFHFFIVFIAVFL